MLSPFWTYRPTTLGVFARAHSNLTRRTTDEKCEVPVLVQREQRMLFGSNECRVITDRPVLVVSQGVTEKV
jgi:hypothetical protein